MTTPTRRPATVDNHVHVWPFGLVHSAQRVQEPLHATPVDLLATAGDAGVDVVVMSPGKRLPRQRLRPRRGGDGANAPAGRRRHEPALARRRRPTPDARGGGRGRGPDHAGLAAVRNPGRLRRARRACRGGNRPRSRDPVDGGAAAHGRHRPDRSRATRCGPGPGPPRPSAGRRGPRRPRRGSATSPGSRRSTSSCPGCTR